MPSKSFSAVASPTEPVFSTPEAMIGTIKTIEIDNNSSNGAITISFKDTFTPSATTNNPNPSQVTETRKVITVQQGDHKHIYDLNIQIFGDCYAVASRDDSDVNISVDYDLE